MRISSFVISPRRIVAAFAVAAALCACGPDAKPDLDPERHGSGKEKAPVSIAEVSVDAQSLSAAVVAKLSKDTILADCKFVIDGVGEFAAEKSGASFSAILEGLDYETQYTVKASAKASGRQLSSSAAFKTGKHTFNEGFWSCMLELCDSDKDGKISRKEAASVSSAYLIDLGLVSVYGLEFFQNLTDLNCGVNSITEIDISKNQRLMRLEVNENPLKGLDISKNPALTYVSAGGCGLDKIDVSKNTALRHLALQVNSLKSIDVSKLTHLQLLYVSANDLTELDLSNNLDLKEVHTHQNPDLKVVYLKTGQEIASFSKDPWTEIRYK